MEGDQTWDIDALVYPHVTFIQDSESNKGGAKSQQHDNSSNNKSEYELSFKEGKNKINQLKKDSDTSLKHGTIIKKQYVTKRMPQRIIGLKEFAN
jgi:hypothetical protein